jgi:hypothetical protein
VAVPSEKILWALTKREEMLDRKGWDNTEPSLWLVVPALRGPMEWKKVPLIGPDGENPQLGPGVGGRLLAAVQEQQKSGQLRELQEGVRAAYGELVAVVFQMEAWRAQGTDVITGRLLEEISASREVRVVEAVTPQGMRLCVTRERGFAPTTDIRALDSSVGGGVLAALALIAGVDTPEGFPALLTRDDARDLQEKLAREAAERTGT